LVPADGQPVDRASYTVAYAVITPDRTGSAWLPFFSKLNLMQHGKRLENSLGVKVTVSRIDVSGAAPSVSGCKPEVDDDADNDE